MELSTKDIEQLLEAHARGGGQAVAELAVSLFIARASGQVKEDADALRVHARQSTATSIAEEWLITRISRLAALAQRTEQAMKEAADLKTSADELQRQRDSRGETVEVLEQERGNLRAEVDTLKSRCDVLRERAQTAEGEMLRYRKEVERLNERLSAADARASDWSRMYERATQAKTHAESRLAAIRTEIGAHDQEEGADSHATIDAILAVLEGDAPPRITREDFAALEQIETRSQARVERASEVLREVEGDAPNPLMPSNSSPARQHEELQRLTGAVPACVCRLGMGIPCFATRHPCSDTCTHDDAAKVGHPERVKERSDAVRAALKTCPLCKGKGTAVDIDQWPKPTRATPTTCMACDGAGTVEEKPEKDVGRRPENDSDTFVTIENGVEGTMQITRTQLERYADKKADAMRAACMQAVRAWAQTEGYDNTRIIGKVLAAIEGAAP